MTSFLTGLDRVAADRSLLPVDGPIGLLCNNATVDASLRGTVEVLREAGVRIERIFSPQHGFAGEKQDNMIESGHGVHPSTGIPLVSLYGATREPDPATLAGLRGLVVDLPDVGTRVYTFLSTALLCLKACAAARIPLVVLDRPNPIGGTILEGPVLRPDFASFVGLIPVPLRHGLTAGEYLRFGRSALRLDVEIAVIACLGWERADLFPVSGRPWIPPSPNLPTFEGALLYAGMVLFEGTSLSEGRGTTRPFEVCGAPWFDPPGVLRQARPALSGITAREIAFRPTFHKFAESTCRGFMLHPIDPPGVRAVEAAVGLLAAARNVHPDCFAWKDPPYEYEFARLPIDLIAGTDALRRGIESGAGASEIAAGWSGELEEFRQLRRPFLLYPE